MKQFTLQNRQLIIVGEALRDLPTTDFKTNRAKHKLLKLINKKFEEYAEDEKLLIENLAEKDADGEPIKLENGNYKINAANTKQAQKEINELGDMEAWIYYGEFALDIKPAIDYILNYEGHIDAKMGQGLFDLIEAYELSQQTEEEK